MSEGVTLGVLKRQLARCVSCTFVRWAVLWTPARDTESLVAAMSMFDAIIRDGERDK